MCLCVKDYSVINDLKPQSRFPCRCVAGAVEVAADFHVTRANVFRVVLPTFDLYSAQCYLQLICIPASRPNWPDVLCPFGRRLSSWMRSFLNVFTVRIHSPSYRTANVGFMVWFLRCCCFSATGRRHIGLGRLELVEIGLSCDFMRDIDILYFKCENAEMLGGFSWNYFLAECCLRRGASDGWFPRRSWEPVIGSPL